MSRVLVTGGTGAVGGAVVRRLLADPAYDVRVADRKAAPQWMREACELRTGDLRNPGAAAAAMAGCAYAIHLAAPSAPTAGDFTSLTESVALDSAVLSAAVAERLERFVYFSCASPSPQSTHGFALLAGERLCEAAQAEHGLPLVICRPSAQTPEDVATQIVAAMSASGDQDL